MNIKIDFTKVTDFYKQNKRFLPTVLVIMFILVFGTLSFIALYPFNDQSLQDVAQARLEELDIKFNTKILNELETKLKPTEISGVGGRDPFAKF